MLIKPVTKVTMTKKSTISDLFKIEIYQILRENSNKIFGKYIVLKINTIKSPEYPNLK